MLDQRERQAKDEAHVLLKKYLCVAARLGLDDRGLCGRQRQYSFLDVRKIERQSRSAQTKPLYRSDASESYEEFAIEADARGVIVHSPRGKTVITDPSDGWNPATDGCREVS